METIRRIVILYGSQSGTAEETAERIGREAKRLHFETVVSSMNDYDVRLLPSERLAIFIASTTGQGQEPDNMKRFWRFLIRKSLPTSSLESLKFGVLALGDSSYQKFNFVGKKLYRRLLQLGGKAIEPLGLCDDQHDLGPDFVIDPWTRSFWKQALTLYPLPPDVNPIDPSIIPPPRYKVVYYEDKDRSKVSTSVDQQVRVVNEAISKENPFSASILKCERVTSEDHFQETRLITLDIRNSNLRYRAGDVCNVQPRNLDENVESFFQLFPKLNRKQKFYLEKNPETNSTLPCSNRYPFVTVEDCVRNYFDIQSVPKRSFFELLAYFTTDDMEKEKFNEFNSAEGQQDLYDYCNRPRRNILEVLYDFQVNTTSNIPFEYLFNLIPPIKPRSFSIASAPSEEIMELLVAVVKYRSKLVVPRKGLCSTWLSRLKNEDDRVPIWISSGTFIFPKDTNLPIVMVGPGTGIAPFRSFIRSDPERFDLTLFFGCRNQDKDYYFGSEWKTLVTKNQTFRIFVAFSRDNEDKVYVQHLIERERELVTRMILEENGYFYIAGNAKQMPDQVTDALKNVLKDSGVEDVDHYIKRMEAENRFQTETWS